MLGACTVVRAMVDTPFHTPHRKETHARRAHIGASARRPSRCASLAPAEPYDWYLGNCASLAPAAPHALGIGSLLHSWPARFCFAALGCARFPRESFTRGASHITAGDAHPRPRESLTRGRLRWAIAGRLFRGCSPCPVTVGVWSLQSTRLLPHRVCVDAARVSRPRLPLTSPLRNVERRGSTGDYGNISKKPELQHVRDRVVCAPLRVWRQRLDAARAASACSGHTPQRRRSADFGSGGAAGTLCGVL
jgi:hypothetical protein